MKLIPKAKAEIISPLSKSEVENKLRENIQTTRGIGLSRSYQKNHKPFRGTMEGNTFRIQRIISGKNSFLPQIAGTVSESANGTKILMELKIHVFVVVFMTLWMGGVTLGLVAGLYGMTTQGTNPFYILGPIALLAFAFGMAYYGFNSEKEKAITELKRIVEGRTRNTQFSNTVYD